MIPRIKIDQLVTPERLKNKRLTIIYGGRKRDWMDPTFGETSVEAYTKGGGTASLHFVDEAGHQLILDAPDDFCDMFVTNTRRASGGKASAARTRKADAAAAAIAEAVQ